MNHDSTTVKDRRRSPLKIALVGNYPPDRQESMERFALLLADRLQKLGHDARIIRPAAIVPPPSDPFWFKWIGHLNKYLLFPQRLSEQVAFADIVHICDHSNSIYIDRIRHRPHLITCHDLLAARSALGEQTYCPTSSLGRWLQRFILQGLRRAYLIACDSAATAKDAVRLVGGGRPQRIRLVPLGLNYPYSVLPADLALFRLRPIVGLAANEPYLLHVGSAELRKNRQAVLRIFASLPPSFNGKLVFAGAPLSQEELELARQLQVFDRLVVVVRPNNQTLEALYNRAFVLLFPSLAEGFGWPVIEAQACGCPVIASDRCSVPEVVGSGGIVHDAGDEKSFADSVVELLDESRRQALIELGLQNLQRFDADKMVASYLDLYYEILSDFPNESL